MYVYKYIYIYIRVCVCVCVERQLFSNTFFKMLKNNKYII